MIHGPSGFGGPHLAATVSPIDHIIHYSNEKSSHKQGSFLLRECLLAEILASRTQCLKQSDQSACAILGTQFNRGATMRQTTNRFRKFSTTIAVGAFICVGIASMPVVAQEAADTATIPTVYRDAFQIVVNGKSQTAGTFTMVFTPVKEEGTKFTVNVTQGMGKKRIAQDVAKELTLAAGGRYKVKQNGNKVVVKRANKKEPAFALEITEQKLSGVSLMIGKK